MSTREHFLRSEVQSGNRYFTETRSIVETAFYVNTVVSVTSLKEAYKLAAASPGTIITDMPIYRPEELGLIEDAKILLSNDGGVHGRCAAARRIFHESMPEKDKILEILKEAAYDIGKKKSYHAQCFIGLDEDFMVRARLLIPEGHENILYNWLLNFQTITQEYIKKYRHSTAYEEGDIYIFADPDWRHPDYPYGLSFFDSESNCAVILGMRYFGEFKKGTLTLAWSIAGRNGFASCHGGLKRYNIPDSKNYVMGIFGLSGSGKSTLTHAKHNGRFDVSVLHDDAFIISTDDGSSVALEPSYFDKTQDYPLACEDNKYLLSVQNCGVTVDNEGNKVVVCEDIRNKNGRAIKSMLWSDNRINKVNEKIDAIVWLMKDPVLPPVIRIDDPILASAMGALLATKRTSAERVVNKDDMSQLVFEPYANPFRTYPLAEDYEKFKKLFIELDTDCYIFNTGYFLDQKVTKEITVEGMENIVKGIGVFSPWSGVDGCTIMTMSELDNLDSPEYRTALREAFEKRLEYLSSIESDQMMCLPDEVYRAFEKILNNMAKI